jgi:predicted anti-sigma-YlaC factor YlaD
VNRPRFASVGRPRPAAVNRRLALLRRAGFGLFALLYAVWGGWALGWPAQFYANFPGGGHRWTAAYPPYNPHLIADLGATQVSLAVLLVFAALWDSTRTQTAVVAGVCTFGVLHLTFHVEQSGSRVNFDRIASLASLAAGAFGPAALLATRFVPWTSATSVRTRSTSPPS